MSAVMSLKKDSAYSAEEWALRVDLAAAFRLIARLTGTKPLMRDPDHGMIYRFVPKTVDTSEMELIWLVREDAVEGVDYDFDKLVWLWTVTTDEDKAIIEHTAKGVRSHYYVPGPVAPMEYNELRYIAWYLEKVARNG